MRVLAVDYGERRTGIAVSDPRGITAQGLDTIMVERESLIPKLVMEKAREYNVGKIVVGLPLNMDGTESEKSAKVRAFGHDLEKESGIPVVYYDERMTSLRAQQTLREMERKTEGNKHLIDRIAATILLQDYMQSTPL